MSKKLFDLIKTLSKAEKRVFSENLRHTKRKSYYIKLVADYSKSEAYSSKLDLKIFKSEDPKFISDCKIKCRNFLFDYLVSLEQNRGVRKQVEHKLKIAIMLKNRRQFHEAIRILDRIDIVATRYEMVEELLEIKTQKILLSILTASGERKVDLNYLELLSEEKNRALQHFVDIHNARDEARIASVNWHVKMGAIRCEQREHKLGEDQFQNFSIILTMHQKRFFDHMGDKNYKLATNELEHIICLTDQNKDIVLEARFLTLSYASYLFLYVELCIVLNKKNDIEQVTRQFDSIPYHSVKANWELLTNKMVTGCMYALSVSAPATAIRFIEETNHFFAAHNYLKKDNTGNVLFPVFTYFALGAWEECLSFIEEIETRKISEDTSSALLNIKLICIYEKNDDFYFKSLVNKHAAKKRKNGIKMSNYTKFDDCVFYVLKSIAHRSNNTEECFKKVINSFENDNWRNRYLIHWIVSKFPALLNGEDYATFLENSAFQHYDFTSLNGNNSPTTPSVIL